MMNFLTKKYVKMMNAFDAIKKDKKGQTLVEYALILVLIAIVVLVALGFVGNKVNNVFCKVGGALSD